MDSAYFNNLFESFASLKIGVLGDVMLDTYWWGHVERISPEAPVPVVTVDKREYRIGGAGNVALNLAALGVQSAIISVTGDDEESKLLSKLLADEKIDTKYLLSSHNRTTTNKIRIISRNQQMMRLDAETNQDIEAEDVSRIFSAFEKYIQNENPALIILEDYNKGILTESVIKKLIAICVAAGIPVAVDPKRKNFFAYSGATIFKPNLKEAKEALNILSEEVSPALLRKIHNELKEKLHHSISLITLSEKGIFYESENDRSIIPTHVRNIADVSGAGDTVIAVAATVYAASKNEKLMAEMANIAGGLVCEEVGTAAINRKKLLEECRELLIN